MQRASLCVKDRLPAIFCQPGQLEITASRCTLRATPLQQRMDRFAFRLVSTPAKNSVSADMAPTKIGAQRPTATWFFLGTWEPGYGSLNLS